MPLYLQNLAIQGLCIHVHSMMCCVLSFVHIPKANYLSLTHNNAYMVLDQIYVCTNTSAHNTIYTGCKSWYTVVCFLFFIIVYLLLHPLHIQLLTIVSFPCFQDLTYIYINNIIIINIYQNKIVCFSNYDKQSVYYKFI